MALEIYYNFLTSNSIVVLFLVERRGINMQVCENTLRYHTRTTLMQNCLKLSEIGMYILYI